MMPREELEFFGAEFGRLRKEPTDFTSGLKLPKLEQLPALRGGSGDCNDKVRNFKESRKTEILNHTTLVGEDMSLKTTGLFRTNPLLGNSDISDGEGDAVPNLNKKVKGILARQRKKNRLDHEVHSRISKAFDKMEIFEKGIRSFDDTLLLAKGRLAAEVGKKSERTSPRHSGRSGITETSLVLAEVLKLPKSLKEVSEMGVKAHEPRTLAVESETIVPNYSANAFDDPDENLRRAKPTQASTNLSLRRKWSSAQLEIPKSNLEKQWLMRPKLHERKGNQDLSGLRSKLEILNRRTEHARNKKAIQNKMESVYTGDGNLTRLMTDDLHQGPPKQFMDFLQATGGTTGGWSKEDHETFLTANMKWTHKPEEVIKIVSSKCPGRQVEDVAAHLEWFEKFEVLNAANKAFVQKWKIDKRRERQQMYKMSREEAKASIEGQKSREEMIKAKREVERQREKSVLNLWKKSKKPEIMKLEIENDMLRDPDGPGRTSKLGQHLQLTKERLVKLLPPAHQVRQVLTKSRLSLGIQKEAIEKQPKNTDSVISNQSISSKLPEPSTVSETETTSPSNETFPDTQDLASEEFNSLEINQSIDQPLTAETTVTACDDIPISSPPTITGSQTLKRSASEKMLAFYRTRDDRIVAAKRNATLAKEAQKNKGFLTTEEVKKRISKIRLPSQVTRMTKGIELRQNLRQLEAIEASAREELKKSQSVQHRNSRVPTPQMFKTGPLLQTIPKLGSPAWRTRNA